LINTTLLISLTCVYLYKRRCVIIIEARLTSYFSNGDGINTALCVIVT